MIYNKRSHVFFPMALKKFLDTLPKEYLQGSAYEDLVKEFHLETEMKTRGYIGQSKNALYFLFPQIARSQINSIFVDSFTEAYEKLKANDQNSGRQRRSEEPVITVPALITEIRSSI